jgi:hypothetical protein
MQLLEDFDNVVELRAYIVALENKEQQERQKVAFLA